MTQVTTAASELWGGLASRAAVVNRRQCCGTQKTPDGDVAVLTFNLVSYGKKPDRVESALARWNATRVYSRIDGQWRIVRELKQTISEIKN